jgi:pimeloyl-ACP methyl ester carboxylesterase
MVRAAVRSTGEPKMQPTIKRGFADTSVGQVHYRFAGPASAQRTPPLVMFHGSPSSSHSLARQIANLAESRTVIAFDTMGQGDSCPPPSRDVTFVDYARYYAEALTSLGPEYAKVDLFGTHTGGRIAAEFALGFPQRTRKLILDGMRRGPSDFWNEYAASLDFSQYIDEDGTQFYKAWSRLKDSFYFFPAYRRDPAHFRGNPLPNAQELHAYALEVFKGISWSHVPYQLAVLYPSEERLPKITCPTLVTCAPTDGPFADLEYVARLIKGAIAMAHPHKAKMDAASDAEIAGLAKMLADWLDGTSC